MADEKVSIIIPIHNVERYLNRSVESVLQQSYRNIEVLLIDDGSTDNSGKRCDEWKEKDARIRVIHKKNGGVSDTRNAGLDAATGDFIAFVDSDDYTAPDMIEKLYAAQKKYNADMSICGFQFVDENGTPITEKNRKLPKIEGVFSGRDAIKYSAEYNWYYNVLWNKLFKKALFSEVRFPKVTVCEDLLASHQLLELCQTIVCIRDIGYYYVRRNGSILNTRSGRTDLDRARAFLEHASFFYEHGLQRGAGRAYLQAAVSLADAEVRTKGKPEMQRELEETFQRFKESAQLRKYGTKKEKLQLTIINQSPELYYYFFRTPVRQRVKTTRKKCVEKIRNDVTKASKKLRK